jgi:hypothetical protein
MQFQFPRRIVTYICEMHKFWFFIFLVSLFSCSTKNDTVADLETHYEKTNKTESAPYFEGIEWWKNFASSSSNISVTEFGETDAGYPLHVVVLSNKTHQLAQLRTSPKSLVFINNAIHPGEPDGVDASMMLFRDILLNHAELLDSCNIVCIPYYNIGGAINRNSNSRANQNGPLEYGFRGNAQNLDLNRDFVKCDSRNAQSFAQLLQLLDPDFYIETHVSNGANYQYNITYLSTQPTKLGYEMGNYLSTNILPDLNVLMKEKDQEMVPYVNIHGGPLDSSYNTFYDSPRYSSGLTTLHNIFGFITETHMLKPFSLRVEATYDYLLSSIQYCSNHTSKIKQIRKAQKESIATTSSFALDWELDSSFKDLQFNGFEYSYKPSSVSGELRLYYDTTKPLTKSVRFYHEMKPTISAVKPKFYILRRGFYPVEDRLSWNGVPFKGLKSDTIIHVVSYKITSYESKQQVFEKHYSHYNTSFERDTISWQFRKGDLLIPMGNDKDRFVVEMLEPNGPDSYFNWNFFDAILQQKEWYSAYVFEDKAALILQQDSILNRRFQQKKQNEPAFAANAQWQLHWVFLNSPHYEKEHMRLPIFRIE